MTKRSTKNTSERAAGIGSAAQPADQSTQLRNVRRRAAKPHPHGAEQPGSQNEAAVLASLEDCAMWLSTLTTNGADPPVRRLKAALHVLQADPSSARRSAIQSMLKSWGVTQKQDNAKIAAPNVEAMLASKVMEEACRMKSIHDASGSFSAIRLALAMRAGEPPTCERRTAVLPYALRNP